MNYKIIQNEYLLNKFIESLPDNIPGTKYYLCLFARKKYDSTGQLKSDKCQLKRIIANKKDIVSKIKQLEIAEGCYSFNGVPVRQETLAMYMMPNLRDTKKATALLTKKCIDLLVENIDYNPVAEAYSAYQNCSAKKTYTDFDFDNVSAETIQDQVKNILNSESYRILVTRGGVHLLVEPNKVDDKLKKTWHQSVSKIPGCDCRGDQLLPVPGCTQGGFVPYFL